MLNKDKISAMCFIALLALFAVSAIYTTIHHSLIQKLGQKEYGIINSELFATFEKEFKDAVPYNDPLLHGWGALQYGVFNSGKPGVVIGADEWLFTKEEFEWLPDYYQHIGANQEFISQAAAQLQQEGLELIIVPIPAKARVYKEQLGAHATPEYRAMVYPGFMDYLESQKLYYVDMFAHFQAMKDEAEAPLYMRTDTHWSQQGARVTAKKVKAYFDEGLKYSIDFKKTRTEVVKGDSRSEIPYRGDLTEFVPTGFWSEFVGPKSEWIDELKLEKASSGGGLFGDVELPIALVGTSYSAEAEWHFADFLGDVFDAEIWNLADEGQGPFTPMQTFLKEKQWQGKGVKLVIWEIPERFLPVKYELNINDVIARNEHRE